MSSSGRQYDVVLYGATGYTGKLTASYMATHLPTDAKWAISGRSESKLEAVAAICKGLSPDRVQPVVEICNLDDAEMGDLARKTTILVTTVGPYSMYGEHAFRACAENGTHYIDCTGETPWVHKMIQKYERTAKSTGAIMVPQNGIESAPPDLITWSLVSLIRNEISAPTGSVILSQHDSVTSISGGTGLTALTFMDYHTLSEIAATSVPFALSPIPGPSSHTSASLLTRLFGIRAHPTLGLLTTAIQAGADTPIVQRTWGLLGGAKLYGPHFFYEQYVRTTSYIRGILLHFATNFGILLLAVPPVRWGLKRLIYAPGDGPTEEESKSHRVEYRAVAVADVETRGPKPKAFARAWFEGGMYHLTAVLLTEAAVTLLKDDVVAKKSGGGILTPATLGQPYIDRVDRAGFKFETRMLEPSE